MKIRLAAATILMSMATAQTAAAQDAGEWIVRSGFHSIEPKSRNHALVNVDDQIGFTFNATYMFAPNWGVELLAALPFTHGIALNGAGTVAEADLLPPTLSAQYHFNPNPTSSSSAPAPADCFRCSSWDSWGLRRTWSTR